jgi:hypothetical protein
VKLGIFFWKKSNQAHKEAKLNKLGVAERVEGKLAKNVFFKAVNAR